MFNDVVVAPVAVAVGDLITASLCVCVTGSSFLCIHTSMPETEAAVVCVHVRYRTSVPTC